MRGKVVSSIRPSFPGLSQSQGQVTHVLLTRSPLIPPASWGSSFDLHVLSTPPAFILSQDQTLRKKIRTQHKPPGKRRTHAAQNSKPAKKPATPHRSGMTSKSTNQKTIGINKHGTLLSSQTTEAPGTKHNPQGRIIAPEQLFKLTRQTPPRQIHPFTPMFVATRNNLVFTRCG